MHEEKRERGENSIALSSADQRRHCFKRAAGDLNPLLKSSQKQRKRKKMQTDPALIYTDTVKASLSDKLQVNKDRQKERNKKTQLF